MTFMSSRNPATGSKTAAPKSAASAAKSAGKVSPSKAAAARPPKAAAAKTSQGEPTGTQKAAFLKAMYKGIKPGTKAAEKSAAKKQSVKTPESTAAPGSAPQVEVLRRISGAQPVLENEISRAARELATEIERTLGEGQLDALQPHALQAIMTALCKAYAANYDAGNQFPVVSGRLALTGTDVMIVCGSLLKAADLQVFELGMWQSWAGR